MGGVQRRQTRIVDLPYRPRDGLILALFGHYPTAQVFGRCVGADFLGRRRDSTIQRVRTGVGPQTLLAVLDDDAGQVAVESGGTGGAAPMLAPEPPAHQQP